MAIPSRSRPTRRRLHPVVIGNYAAVMGLLLGFCALAGRPTLGGQATPDGPEPAADRATWVEVVRRAQADGTPAVLVVTASSSPESKALARAIVGGPGPKRFAGKVGFAEISADD